MKRKLNAPKSQTPAKRQSLKKTVVPTNEKDEHAVNKAKGDKYEWCSTYPGSLPSLMAPNIKKWTTKLVSWNVNGIRAWMKNGGLDYLNGESPDLVGIQETKCSECKIPPACRASGYITKWSSAKTDGYAGTGLYTKRKPLNISFGINVSKHDKEGRTITAEYEKFYFITAYVPNSGQGLVRLPYRHKEWDPDFLTYLKELDRKKPIILCGDLNVAHKEIDLANPASNHKSAGFTDEEREGFTKLLNEVNLVDTYRELYPDRKNAYTFWSYRQTARVKNTGWRLDYFLVSERLMPHVCDHEIRCGVLGSDHCPIVLYLDV